MLHAVAPDYKIMLKHNNDTLRLVCSRVMTLRINNLDLTHIDLQRFR